MIELRKKKQGLKKKCYVMIIITSIYSLRSITKCDTQSPQTSVMNDLKGHTYLSKKSYEKIKCNQNSKHI